MSRKKNPSVKAKKKNLTHPAVGIWKDKWPESKSSTEVARERRQSQWLRS